MDRVADYRAWLIAELKAHHAAHLTPFLDALEEIDLDTPRRVPRPETPHPALRHLERACAALPIAQARAAAQELDWLPVFEGGGIDPVLAEGMLAAQLAGSYGRIPSERVATGLFLLCPGVNYPLHTHAAEEVYLSLSGVLELKHGIEGAAFRLHPGQYSHTPPGRLHGLRVSGEPVLLAYVWIGALTEPNWWWSEDSRGVWRRTRWARAENEPWRPEYSELVTDTEMRAAHV